MNQFPPLDPFLSFITSLNRVHHTLVPVPMRMQVNEQGAFFIFTLTTIRLHCQTGNINYSAFITLPFPIN